MTDSSFVLTRQSLLATLPRVRRMVLLIVVAGTPLFFLRDMNDPFNLPKLAFLLVGVAIAAALRIIEALQGVPHEGLRRILIPAGALGIPLLLAWLFSPYRGWALFGEYGKFQGLIPYLLVIVLGILVADAFAGDTNSLLWALALSAGIAGAYGALQQFGVDPFPWNFTAGRDPLAISTLGNENFAGAYLAIGLPIIAGAWFLMPARRIVLGCFFVATGFALFTTRSQAPWVGALAGMAVLGTFLIAHGRRWVQLVGVAAAMVAAAAVVGAVLVTIVAPESRFVVDTTRVRGDWWQASTDMALDRPLVGHGPNTFSLVGAAYRPPEDAVDDGYDFSDDPHSVLFSLLAGAGFLGALGFVGVAGWAVLTALRSDIDQVAAGALLGAIAAYFITALVSIDEISLRVAAWGALGGLGALRVGLHQTSTASTRKKSKKSQRYTKHEPVRQPIAAGTTVVVGVLLVVYAGSMVVADARVNHATDLFQQSAFSEGRAVFRDALALRDDAYYRRLMGYWVGEVATHLGQDGGDDYYAELPAIFDYLRSVPDPHGRDLYVRYLRLWSRFHQDKLEEARDLLADGVAFDPLNPIQRVDLAEVSYLLGDSEGALDALQPAIKLVDGSYPETRAVSVVRQEVWATYAILLALSGDDAGARAALEKARAEDPADALVRLAQSVLDDDPDADFLVERRFSSAGASQQTERQGRVPPRRERVSPSPSD